MEIWKDIIGYEGLYQVSNLGNVKSLKYGKEKILSKCINSRGYLNFQLSKNNIPKSYYGHRLTLEAFIQNNNNKEYINHINGIKTDNRLENLEWCTAKENTKHSFDILGNTFMLGKFGEKHHLSKKVNQYDLQGNFIKTWEGLRSAGRELNIRNSKISEVCKGIKKTAGGFIWEYFQ